MKKLLSFLLALIITVSAAAPLSAFAEGENTRVSGKNPMYTGEEIDFGGSVDSYASDPSVTRKYNGKTYYGKGKQLYSLVGKQLAEKKRSFTVRYLAKGTTPAVLDLFQEIFYFATEDEIATGYKDGDYARWSWEEFLIASRKLDTAYDGYYYITFKVEVEYYCNETEEKKADEAVNKFISSLDTNSLSDYEIIKKIHDRICNSTTYDYDAVDDPYAHTYAFTTYGALVKGKCVCQGYASAFYRICRELGYRVRLVASDSRLGCHAWNIVELDGKFYFVDCTWDDVVFDKDTDEYPEYYYFLVSYSTTTRHDSVLGEHKLDAAYFDSYYFNRTYRDNFDDNNYDRSNYSLMSRSRVKLSSRTFVYDSSAKKPSVRVTDGYGNELKAGSDYTVSYSSNVNTGQAKAVISDGSTKTHRCFVIKPSAAQPLSAKTSADTVSLSWSASKGGVSGYSVEAYRDGKWKQELTTTANSAQLTLLKSATRYKYRIRAYKDIAKRRYYGDYSPVRECVTKPKKVGGVLIGTAKGRLNISFNKTKSSGYIIQYSDKKNMKGAKELRLKGADRTSKTVKKLKSGKRYYVRIRAYKTYSMSGRTKTAYGKWSSKKSIKIK